MGQIISYFYLKIYLLTNKNKMFYIIFNFLRFNMTNIW